jgi:hypothetical protein
VPRQSVPIELETYAREFTLGDLIQCLGPLTGPPRSDVLPILLALLTTRQDEHLSNISRVHHRNAEPYFMRFFFLRVCLLGLAEKAERKTEKGEQVRAAMGKKETFLPEPSLASFA